MRGDPGRVFRHRLALALGRTLAELDATLTEQELRAWVAYDRIHPLPDPWLQTGLLCALTANVWRSGGRAFKPEDFMPRPPLPVEDVRVMEAEAIANALAASNLVQVESG